MIFEENDHSNAYEILEISPFSSFEEIKSSYQRLAKKWHPDKNINGNNTVTHFQRLQRAWDQVKQETRFTTHKQPNSSVDDLSALNQRSFEIKIQNAEKVTCHDEHNAHNEYNKYKEHNKDPYIINLHVPLSISDCYNGCILTLHIVHTFDLPVFETEICTECSTNQTKMNQLEITLSITPGTWFDEKINIKIGNNYSLCLEFYERKITHIEDNGNKTLHPQIQQIHYTDICSSLYKKINVLDLKPSSISSFSSLKASMNGSVSAPILNLSEVKCFKLAENKHDLFLNCEISLYEALLGVFVTFKHLNGRKYLIRSPLPPNQVWEPGLLLKIQNHGMPLATSPLNYRIQKWCNKYSKENLQIEKEEKDEEIKEERVGTIHCILIFVKESGENYSYSNGYGDLYVKFHLTMPTAKEVTILRPSLLQLLSPHHRNVYVNSLNGNHPMTQPLCLTGTFVSPQ